jgi:hypothetical protein
MDGMQVVVDQEPLADPQLGQTRLHALHVWEYRGKVRNPRHRRRGEEQGATGPAGKPPPRGICAGLACHADLSYSGVRRCRPGQCGPGGRC